MQTSKLEYFHGDTALEGFLAYKQDDAPKPAVIICHAWKGRDQFVCDKAIEVAQQGYVGFALDVYGKGVLGNSVEENSKLMTPFIEDRNYLQERLASAYETIKQQPQVIANKIAAIGYCFGGLCSLDMVRSGMDLAGAVSFHGILQPRPQKNTEHSNSKVLVLHGDKDPMVSFDDLRQCRDELTSLGCDWRMHVYSQALHAFTNPEANDQKLGTVYDRQADKHSSLLLWDFLRELFG